MAPTLPRADARIRRFVEAQPADQRARYEALLDDPESWLLFQSAMSRPGALEHGAIARPVDVDDDLLEPYTRTRRRPPREARRELERVDKEAARRRRLRAAGRHQHQRAAARGISAADLEHDAVTLFKATPDDARPAADRAHARAALLSYGPFRARRADAQERIFALYELLTLSTSPSMTTSPGEAAAIARLGWHRATYYAHLAWLIRHRFLGVVCSGLSANYMGRRNIARRAVYLVTTPFVAGAVPEIPRVDEGERQALRALLQSAWDGVRQSSGSPTDDLSPTPSEAVDLDKTYSRARKTVESDAEPLRGPASTAGAPLGRRRPASPTSLSDRELRRLRKKRPEGSIELARALRERFPLLRERMSWAALTQAIAPFVAAGDTVADLTYRIQVRPDGRPHVVALLRDVDVKRPAGFLLYLLKLWLTDTGEVIHTPGKLRRLEIAAAQERRALRAELDQRAHEQSLRAWNDPEYRDYLARQRAERQFGRLVGAIRAAHAALDHDDIGSSSSALHTVRTLAEAYESHASGFPHAALRDLEARASAAAKQWLVPDTELQTR